MPLLASANNPERSFQKRLISNSRQLVKKLELHKLYQPNKHLEVPKSVEDFNSAINRLHSGKTDA